MNQVDNSTSEVEASGIINVLLNLPVNTATSILEVLKEENLMSGCVKWYCKGSKEHGHSVT